MFVTCFQIQAVCFSFLSNICNLALAGGKVGVRDIINTLTFDWLEQIQTEYVAYLSFPFFHLYLFADLLHNKIN